MSVTPLPLGSQCNTTEELFENLILNTKYELEATGQYAVCYSANDLLTFLISFSSSSLRTSFDWHFVQLIQFYDQC